MSLKTQLYFLFEILYRYKTRIIFLKQYLFCPLRKSPKCVGAPAKLLPRNICFFSINSKRKSDSRNAGLPDSLHWPAFHNTDNETDYNSFLIIWFPHKCTFILVMMPFGTINNTGVWLRTHPCSDRKIILWRPDLDLLLYFISQVNWPLESLRNRSPRFQFEVIRKTLKDYQQKDKRSKW